MLIHLLLVTGVEKTICGTAVEVGSMIVVLVEIDTLVLRSSGAAVTISFADGRMVVFFVLNLSEVLDVLGVTLFSLITFESISLS